MGITKNFAYNGLLTVSQYLFPLITFPYLTRVLGVHYIGLTSWLNSILDYGILFSSLGISILGLREIAGAQGDKEKLRIIFSELQIIHFLFSLLVCACFVVLCTVVDSFREHRELLYWGIGKIIFNVFVVEWFFKGTEQFRYITFRLVAVQALYVIAIFTFVKRPDDYVLYYFFTILLVVVNAMVNQFNRRRYVSFSFAGVSLGHYIMPFIILGLYMISVSMYTTFNITYLGMVSSADSVGYYTVAQKIYIMVLSLFSALSIAIMPQVNKLYSNDRHTEMLSIIRKSFSIVSTFSFPIILCGIVLAPQILQVISGDDYRNAVGCLRIIFPLVAVTSMSQILGNQVLMTFKKDTLILFSSVISAGVGISLNILLVGRYAYIGSAAALVAAELMLLVLLYVFSQIYTPVAVPVKNILYHFLSALPLGGICFLIVRYFDGCNSFLIILGCMAVCIPCFLLTHIFVLRNTLIIDMMARVRAIVQFKGKEI